MKPLTLLALFAVAAAPPPDGGRFVALPEGDGIRIHVAKRGLFSAFAHDHDFEVTRWRGDAAIPGGDPARASLEVVLEASSLRDREKGSRAAIAAGSRRRRRARRSSTRRTPPRSSTAPSA